MRAQLFELAEEISDYLEHLVPALAVLRSAGHLEESAAGRREELPPVRARREVAAWFSRAMARGLLRRVPPEQAADLFLGALQFRPNHHHLSGQGFERDDSRAFREFVVDTITQTLDPSSEDG